MIKLADPGAKLLSLAIAVFGVYVVYEGAGMNIGTLRRIGPGFFPILLGTAIALFGIATFFEPSERRRDEGFGLRPLFCVTLALLSFALLARSAGLFPATFALVALTTLGQRRVDLKAAAVTALILCAIGYFLFIQGLRLPLEPFTAITSGGRG